MSEPAMKWNGGEGDAAKSAASVIPKFLQNADMRPSSLSYIEPHEVVEAIKQVDENWLAASKGKPLKFRPAGYKILIRLYVRPELLRTITAVDGTTYELKLPESVTAEDKFISCTGLVLRMGEQCYTGTLRDGSLRYPNGPWCKIGDWICVDRYAGKRVTINGVACMIINDDSVDGVIDEPSDIQAGHVEYKS